METVQIPVSTFNKVSELHWCKFSPCDSNPPPSLGKENRRRLGKAVKLQKGTELQWQSTGYYCVQYSSIESSEVLNTTTSQRCCSWPAVVLSGNKDAHLQFCLFCLENHERRNWTSMEDHFQDFEGDPSFFFLILLTHPVYYISFISLWPNYHFSFFIHF